MFQKIWGLCGQNVFRFRFPRSPTQGPNTTVATTTYSIAKVAIGNSCYPSARLAMATIGVNMVSKISVQQCKTTI